MACLKSHSFPHRDFLLPVYQRIRGLLQEISMKLEMGETLEKEDVAVSNGVVKIISQYLKVNFYEFEGLSPSLFSSLPLSPSLPPFLPKNLS